MKRHKLYLKSILLITILFTATASVAQTDSSSRGAVRTDSSDAEYTVELVNNTSITGKKVSDDGREVGIMTKDRGLILIPKYEIKSITLVSSMPVVSGNRVFPNPHPSRYYYSPSGIPMKKGEGYIQSICYLAFQAQYALTDNWSIGATTPLWAAPFLVNAKFTNVLRESADKKKNVYLAAGIQAGTLSYIDPGTWLGVGYVGLTFGNPESNITINGGLLGVSRKRYTYNYPTYTVSRDNQTRPAVSLSWNQRVSATASFMGEFWYVGDYIIGGPGLRFYSGRKNAIDIALLGGYDLDFRDGIFGIPFVSWTRKFGSK